MSRSRHRLFLLAFSLLLVAGASVGSEARAAGPTSVTGGDPITRVALSQLGQYGGECYTWVRSVVRAATGRTIGFDYRAGYFEAGATEVPSSEAVPGDVIQIVNDAITVPTADYPGLHTAIVLSNEGGGRFEVIDSNSNFDGLIHIRDHYDPAAEAARYSGLGYHVYRFAQGGAAAAPPAAATPAAVAPAPALAPGGRATVSAGGDCLTLRAIPTTVGTPVTCLPSGAPVLVLAIGPAVDGHHWVQVVGGGHGGWVAADYLAPAPAATPPSGTPATTSAAATPAAAAPPAAAPAAAATPTATPHYTVEAGDTLSGIAARFRPPGTSIADFVDRLERANGLGADGFIAIGQVLALPGTAAATPDTPAPTTASSPPTTTTPPATATRYTVVPGDTLWGIAERFQPSGTTVAHFVDQLEAANGLGADAAIDVGQMLTIPAPGGIHRARRGDGRGRGGSAPAAALHGRGRRHALGDRDAVRSGRGRRPDVHRPHLHGQRPPGDRPAGDRAGARHSLLTETRARRRAVTARGAYPRSRLATGRSGRGSLRRGLGEPLRLDATRAGGSARATAGIRTTFPSPRTVRSRAPTPAAGSPPARRPRRRSLPDRRASPTCPASTACAASPSSRSWPITPAPRGCRAATSASTPSWRSAAT